MQLYIYRVVRAYHTRSFLTGAIVYNVQVARACTTERLGYLQWVIIGNFDDVEERQLGARESVCVRFSVSFLYRHLIGGDFVVVWMDCVCNLYSYIIVAKVEILYTLLIPYDM
jgi:hypothetical protein